MKNDLIYQYYVSDNDIPFMVDYSWKSVRSYASKFNLKYIQNREPYFKDKIFNDPKKDNYICYFDILRIIYDPFFDDFDNVLYLDSDVVISKNSENIFTHVNEKIEDVACTRVKAPIPEDDSFYKRCSGIYNTFKSKKLLELYFKFNAPVSYDKENKNKTGKYVSVTNSSGVVMFSKKGRLKAREKFDDWKLWFSKLNLNNQDDLGMYLDMYYMDAMFNKYLNVYELNKKWNYIVNHYKKEYLTEEYFYHFANDLKKDIDIIPFIETL